MTTYRVAKRDRFATIDRRTVNDERLSFKAKGLLVWLLDKPDDWRVTSDEIAKVGPDGRDAVRSALRELEDAGYLRRERVRKPDGTFSSTTTVYERPELTGDGFSGGGSAAVGSPGALMNTDTEIPCATHTARSPEREIRTEPTDTARSIAMSFHDHWRDKTGKAPTQWRVPALIKWLVPLLKAGHDPPAIKRVLADLLESGENVTPQTIENRLIGRTRAPTAKPRKVQDNPYAQMFKEMKVE